MPLTESCPHCHATVRAEAGPLGPDMVGQFECVCGKTGCPYCQVENGCYICEKPLSAECAEKVDGKLHCAECAALISGAMEAAFAA